jgi:hypothetical protein
MLNQNKTKPNSIIPNTTDNIAKEEISIAYLEIISAKANVSFNICRRDVESQDILLTYKFVDKNEIAYVTNLYVQLKCARRRDVLIKDNKIHYALKSKNYNDLSAIRNDNIILCLLILPNWEKSIDLTLKKLIIKGCMYWKSLNGYASTDNSSSKTIEIPTANHLNSKILIDIFEKIRLSNMEKNKK